MGPRIWGGVREGCRAYLTSKDLVSKHADLWVVLWSPVYFHQREGLLLGIWATAQFPPPPLQIWLYSRANNPLIWSQSPFRPSHRLSSASALTMLTLSLTQVAPWQSDCISAQLPYTSHSAYQNGLSTSQPQHTTAKRGTGAFAHLFSLPKNTSKIFTLRKW